MSNDAITAVWRRTTLPNDRKVAMVILLRLADHANGNDEAWPKVTSLARDCRTDRRTVQRALVYLQELGEIVQVAAAGDREPSAVYRITPGGLSPQRAQPSEGSALSGVSPQQVRAQPTKSEGSAHKGGGLSPPKPKEEPSEEPKGNPQEDAHDDVREIFEFWRTTFGKSDTTKLTPERREKVKARLKKYSAADVKLAIENVAASAFHVENGYVDLRMICASDSKLEEYRDELPKRRNGIRHPVADRSMAARERSMRTLESGQDERMAHGRIVSLVRTIIEPPEPGAMDPFTDEPLMQPDEARAKLAELVRDVDAAVEEHRPEVLRTSFRALRDRRSVA